MLDTPEHSLPSGKASIVISGPIVDAITGAPVVADVYVDGALRLSKTDHLALAIPLQRDRQTEVRVVAPGYQDWAVAVSGVSSKQLQGPVRMWSTGQNQKGSAILMVMAEP